jgi:hypothetical protein
MALTYSARLKREMLARRAKPSQQFGQSHDVRTKNGATGCTDTVLQWMIWRTKGKWVTQDEIRRIAGVLNVLDRGLRPAEVQRVINHYGLPYKIVNGWSPLAIAKASKLGLVGIAHLYPWWPEWRGFRYGTVKADGKPNGYATPTGKAGRTQLSGFYGRHMGMLLGYATDPDGPDLYYGWEPNHGSAVRPEKPPYDRFSYDQWEGIVKSFGTTYAIVPKGAKP